MPNSLQMVLSLELFKKPRSLNFKPRPCMHTTDIGFCVLGENVEEPRHHATPESELGPENDIAEAEINNY